MDLQTAMAFVGASRNGVLVTLKADGRPQLSNITYALGEDGMIRVSITDSRAKTKNLRRDPRVSMHVTSGDFWQYVVVEGRAELTPVAGAPDDATADELVAYYRSVRGEHPDWDDYRRAMVAEGRLILRLRPERAYGMLR
jgi:PPOX class probable F420-dependent enzyme